MKKALSKSMAWLLSMVMVFALWNIGIISVNAADVSEMYPVDSTYAFLKSVEGYSPQCFWDVSQWTIGYGNKCPYSHNSNGSYTGQKGGHYISEADAKALFEDKLTSYVNTLKSNCSGLSMNQNQFDALLSATYNHGNVNNCPLKYYLQGKLSESEARSQYLEWCINKGTSTENGLRSRRKKEADLFFSNNSPILPTTINNRNYSIPATVYASHKIYTYNEYGNQESNRWIDQGDKCYIDAIYVNDYVHVQYPTSGSSEPNRWTYAKLSDFTDVLPQPIPKPSGYNIRVSSTSIYDCESLAVTVTPFEDNFTNIRFYLVKPDGSVIFKDYGTTKSVSLALNKTGVWKIYARVDNAYGSFEGSTSNGCMSVTVSRPNMGSKVDLGSDFYAYIVNKDSGNALTNDNDNVSSKTLQSTTNQRWHFKKQSDGSYQIESVSGNGKCLDAYSGKGRSGDNVQVYKQNNEPVQQWWIYSAGSSVYYLMPTCSGSAVLDVYDASKTSGANVQIWVYNQTVAQKFEIRKIEAADISLSTSSVSLNLNGTNTATVKITASGNLPSSYHFSANRDTSAMETSWGEWSGSTTPITIKGKKTGTYDLKISLVDGNTDQTLTTKTITVNISCSHSYGSWTTTKQPTCTAEGTQQRKCSVCGKTETQTIKATGHNYTTTVIRPTCTEQGYTQHTCNKCSYSYKDNFTSATGHSYTTKIIVPTCTEKGYTLHTCSNCGNSYKDTYKNKISHEYSEWTMTDNQAVRKCVYCSVEETKPLASKITLDKSTASIEKKQSITLTANVSPDDAFDKTVKWITSNSSVATVSNGTVTAKAAGTATITAKTSNGKTATCTVNVTDSSSVIVPTGITLNKTSATLSKGDVINIYATVLPTNASDKTVTWSSSNTSVAAVSKGNITAKSAGTATITAKTSNGITATCTVTVKGTSISKLNNTSVVNSDIVQVGDKIRVAPSANGGSGEYSSAVYYKRSTASTWKTLGKEFGNTFKVSNSTVAFQPTSEGTFNIKVVIKDTNGSIAEQFFTVDVVKELELTNISVMGRFVVNLGTAIPMIGKAVGGSAPYTYSFYFKRSTNTNWKLLGDKFTDKASARFKPTAKGTYDVRIDVKDSSGTIVKKFFTATVK